MMSFELLLEILSVLTLVLLIGSVVLCVWGTFSMVYDIHEQMVPKKDKKKKDLKVPPEIHLG